jgi:hypothetical protein
MLEINESLVQSQSHQKSNTRSASSGIFCMTCATRSGRGSDNVTQLPEPFRDLVKQRYWSSQFAAVADPDATDLRKPDLVLVDFRLKKADKNWANNKLHLACKVFWQFIIHFPTLHFSHAMIGSFFPVQLFVVL